MTLQCVQGFSPRLIIHSLTLISFSPSISLLRSSLFNAFRVEVTVC